MLDYPSSVFLFLLVLFPFVLAASSFKASLMAQRIKRLPAKQETQVLSLGWEDPPEKEMAIHSSILAWRITCAEEPGGLLSMGFPRQEY